jgi:hypothetical protein
MKVAHPIVQINPPGGLFIPYLRGLSGPYLYPIGTGGSFMDMGKRDFTTAIEVDGTPQQAFQAVNDVRKWWNPEPKGKSQALHDEFEVRFGDMHYSRQKLVEVIPDKKIVWLVTDSKLTFVKDQTEWTGTKVVFEIAKKGKRTEIRLTHAGLATKLQCYDGCSGAWGQYLRNSLARLIEKGKGQPGFPPEDPVG